MKRIFRALWKAYLIGAAVLAGAACLSLAGLAATGSLTMDRVRALERAVLESKAEAHSRRGAHAVAAKIPAGGPTLPGNGSPPEILKEIQRATEDLRIWEDRIDLLGVDLVKTLATASEKDQTQQEIGEGLAKLKKELVPLLNELFAGVPGFQPLTEEGFWPALLAGEIGGSGTSLVKDLRKLRNRESSLSESARSLGSLAPEVLAGILVAGFKPGAGNPLTGEQALRLLSAMEPARLARVFKAVQEEDPRQAALLMSLVLNASAGSLEAGRRRDQAPGGANEESGEFTGRGEIRG